MFLDCLDYMPSQVGVDQKIFVRVWVSNYEIFLIQLICCLKLFRAKTKPIVHHHQQLRS